jgi:hypothetical protein
VALVAIASTDIVFAIDSVTAAFSVSRAAVAVSLRQRKKGRGQAESHVAAGEESE